MHKDRKLGIMTNVDKNRLVKGIFTNIHKISDAWANSLLDTSWLHNVWEMFLLFIKFKFLYKNDVPEKIETHLPRTLLPSDYNNCLVHHLFNFIQKIVSPIPI